MTGRRNDPSVGEDALFAITERGELFFGFGRHLVEAFIRPDVAGQDVVEDRSSRFTHLSMERVGGAPAKSLPSSFSIV